jgi:glycosyltransferase XagB
MPLRQIWLRPSVAPSRVGGGAFLRVGIILLGLNGSSRRSTRFFEAAGSCESVATLDAMLDKYRKSEEQLTRNALRSIIAEQFSEELRHRATLTLFEHFPESSARTQISIRKKFLPYLIFATILVLLFHFRIFDVTIAYIFAALFVTSSALRLWALANPARPSLAPPDIHVEHWPIYTVLIPLYDEAETLQQMLNGLSALNYPVEKLDIKFLIEETDDVTRRAFSAVAPAANMEVLIVPKGEPRTKPRALNYGLQFARGEFLTIYDGEDIPQPRQLQEAVRLFRARSEQTVCLQAQLKYFNANENWLTRQFALEYAVHFGALLPTMARAGLPLMLGGTSNHFRVSTLREVCGWDPYNVTEDADLGMRLARRGYRVEMLASSTLEEAVTSLPAWIKQRSRWFKGLMITWQVHMRHPVQTFQSLGFWSTWVFTSLSMGALFNALLHPLLLVWSIWSLNGTETLGQTFLATLGLVVLTLDYLIYAIVGQIWLRSFYGVSWFSTLITFPLYWLQAYAAAVLALYDLVRSPFHWRKTRHGVSKLIVRTP